MFPAQSAARLLQDALLPEEAGCFSLVLESIPAWLVDLLVSHDLPGIFDRFSPQWVNQYADMQSEMQRAFADYITDVQARAFPAVKPPVGMPEPDWEPFWKQEERRLKTETGEVRIK